MYSVIVMPYPSAIVTIRFLDAPSILSVMVARCLSVCLGGLPFIGSYITESQLLLGEPSGVHSCGSTPYKVASYSDTLFVYS